MTKLMSVVRHAICHGVCCSGRAGSRYQHQELGIGLGTATPAPKQRPA
jgi:hypothetical protein